MGYASHGGLGGRRYKGSLLGKLKVWLAYLSRLKWPLLVYEVAMMRVEPVEPSIGSYLREWLGVRRTMTSVAL